MADILRSGLNQRAAQHTESDKREIILTHIRLKIYGDSYWSSFFKDLDHE